MFKWPFVSVIIVNYNGKDFITECLESVLKSAYPNFEIVIVDNASTDGSYEHLQKAYKRNKRVRLIRSDKQLHFAGGSNLGAKKAKGEKLIFLNSDTVVDRNWIKELVRFTRGRSQYLVQPKILFYGKKNVIDNVGGRYTFFGFGYGIGRDEVDRGQYDQNRRVNYANATAMMIEKKFFWQLGGFDEHFRYFYEDVDLSLRAKRAGGQSWYCYKSVVYHKGSLTFKKNVSKIKVLYYIQRNRLLTLLKKPGLFFF